MSEKKPPSETDRLRKDIKQLQEQVKAQQKQLVEQEHRPLAVLSNLVKSFTRDDEKDHREASTIAGASLLWSEFRKRKIAVFSAGLIGTVIAFSTLLVTYKTLSEFKRQNRIVAKQTDEIIRQNLIIETQTKELITQNKLFQEQRIEQQRSTNAEILTEILKDLKLFKSANKKNSKSLMVVDTLLAYRLLIASNAFTPYIDSMSFERGILVKALTDNKIQFPSYPKMVLRNANLEAVNLSGVDLSGIDFTGSNLKKAILSEANLSKTNLTFVNLDDSNLSGANLDSTILSNTSFVRANLNGALLKGVYISDTNLSHASLVGANLHKTNWENTILDNAILDDANLIKASFIESDLRSAKLRSAFLINATFRNSNLNYADLYQTISTKLSFYNCKLNLTNFSEAYMENSIVESSIFFAAKFENTDLRNTRFLNNLDIDFQALKIAKTLFMSEMPPIVASNLRKHYSSLFLHPDSSS